jgi:hypothetical protein
MRSARSLLAQYALDALWRQQPRALGFPPELVGQSHLNRRHGFSVVFISY